MKLRRSVLSLDQQQVADFLDIPVSFLDKIECGQTRISVNLLLAYARHTKVPVTWFFGGLSLDNGSGEPLIAASNVIKLAVLRAAKTTSIVDLPKAA